MRPGYIKKLLFSAGIINMLYIYMSTYDNQPINTFWHELKDMPFGIVHPGSVVYKQGPGMDLVACCK